MRLLIYNASINVTSESGFLRACDQMAEARLSWSDDVRPMTSGSMEMYLMQSQVMIHELSHVVICPRLSSAILSSSSKTFNLNLFLRICPFISLRPYAYPPPSPMKHNQCPTPTPPAPTTHHQNGQTKAHPFSGDQ